MEDIKYSEKEIAIFNGMIHLLKQGVNPYLVKVSDIAKAAGVGKGTIYDYFETKEEVVTKAMVFNIENEMNLLAKRIKGKKKFKEKYYEILNNIVENLRNEFSTFNMLVSVGGLPQFKKDQLQGNHTCNNHFNKVQGIVDDLLTSGYEEGKIKKIESEYYRRMVLRSSLFAFGNYMAMENMYQEISIQEAMDCSYAMVIKALN